VVPTSLADLNDVQFDYIKMKLKPKLSGVEAARNDMAFVTYQMYAMVKVHIYIYVCVYIYIYIYICMHIDR